MKSSEKILGLEIQLFLLRRGVALEALAEEMGITADGLSNLIHGRRRFKDETLRKLAETRTFQEGRFSLRRLKALRAMDEYAFEELISALMEWIRRGEIERLPADFFHQFQAEMAQADFPLSLADKQHALLSLVQGNPR